VAGRISDRFGDLRALIVSSFAVSLAIVFPLIATRERWYLQFGAYAVWGLFGIVNLCSQTLALRLAPRGDNTIQLSLFRQVSGLLAGLAGLVGGWWLDRLLATAGGAISPYHILFGVSLVGRLTAPFWLLGIREPRPEPNS
jgi:predicted MFS family arabinose efflux permease